MKKSYSIKSRRIRAIAAALCGACLALLVGWKMLPDDRLLLKSKRVVRNVGSFPGAGYAWLSDNELVFIRGGDIYRRDIRTSRERRMVSQPKVSTGASSIQASPRGSWFLCRFHKSPLDSANDIAILFETDSGRQHAVQLLEDVHWTKDGNYLYGTHPTGQGTTFVLLDPMLLRPVKTVNLGKDRYILRVFSPKINVPETAFRDPELARLIGITSLDLRRFELSASVTSVRGRTVESSDKWHDQGTDVIQSGSNVCWTEFNEQSDPVFTSLQRLLPSITANKSMKSELWIGNTEGGKTRKIGYIPIAQSTVVPAYPAYEDFATDVQWLPDGRHISYLYGGDLYVVPVK